MEIADERRLGDWALLKVANTWILAVIDASTESGNGWKISRYRHEEDFQLNGYWRFHDEDFYWKPGDAPCTRNQPYDKYDWKRGYLPKPKRDALEKRKNGDL